MKSSYLDYFCGFLLAAVAVIFAVDAVIEGKRRKRLLVIVVIVVGTEFAHLLSLPILLEKGKMNERVSD